MARKPNDIIKDPIVIAMLVMLVYCVAGISITLTFIVRSVPNETLVDQTFAIRLMQVTVGMVIGLSTIFFGVAVAWFGVTESVEAEVKSSPLTGKVAAAGPGALLVVCGTFLIYICIQKEFTITRTTSTPGISVEEASKQPS